MNYYVYRSFSLLFYYVWHLDQTHCLFDVYKPNSTVVVESSANVQNGIAISVVAVADIRDLRTCRRLKADDYPTQRMQETADERFGTLSCERKLCKSQPVRLMTPVNWSIRKSVFKQMCMKPGYPPTNRRNANVALGVASKRLEIA
jgi:hypothetical protein